MIVRPVGWSRGAAAAAGQVLFFLLLLLLLLLVPLFSLPHFHTFNRSGFRAFKRSNIGSSNLNSHFQAFRLSL